MSVINSQSTALSPGQAKTAGRSILVLEEDPDTREVLRRHLAGRGHSVSAGSVFSSDGFNPAEVDYLIVDTRLLRPAHFTRLREIQKQAPELSMIALHPASSPGLETYQKEAFVRIISQSLPLREVLMRINDVIGGSTHFGRE